MVMMGLMANAQKQIVLENGYIIQKNDTVEIGEGSKPDGNFAYFSDVHWLTTGTSMNKSAEDDFNAMNKNNSYKKAIVYKIEDDNIFYVKLPVRGGGNQKYKVFAKQAVSKGELRTPKEYGNISKASGSSISDELMKLKKLKDDGIITDEEFNKAKSKLIN